MNNLDICITPGANIAFTNITLGLCNAQSHVILIAPYYLSHHMTLTLAHTNVTVCPFHTSTLMPLWDTLQQLFLSLRPTMVIKTYCTSHFIAVSF